MSTENKEVPKAPAPKVVRIEEYRTPVAQAYPDYASRGKARRLRFRGAWTSDGKYHDID